MLLEVKDLSVYYGAINALQGISFHVEEGEIVTLIGANGAGKSTTLNTISGLVRARSGGIRFKEQEISTTPPYEIVSMGIAQVPEGRKIFAPLTVRDNLDMALSRARTRQPFSKAWSGCSRVSRASRSGSVSTAAPCPVVSSRCWP